MQMIIFNLVIILVRRTIAIGAILGQSEIPEVIDRELNLVKVCIKDEIVVFLIGKQQLYLLKVFMVLIWLLPLTYAFLQCRLMFSVLRSIALWWL